MKLLKFQLNDSYFEIIFFIDDDDLELLFFNLTDSNEETNKFEGSLVIKTVTVCHYCFRWFNINGSWGPDKV